MTTDNLMPVLTLAGSAIAWFLGRRMVGLDLRQKRLLVVEKEADVLEELRADIVKCHTMGRKLEADIDDLLRAQQRDKDTHQRMMTDLQRHIQKVEKQYESALGELYTTKKELAIACERFRKSEEWRIDHEKHHSVTAQ